MKESGAKTEREVEMRKSKRAEGVSAGVRLLVPTFLSLSLFPFLPLVALYDSFEHVRRFSLFGTSSLFLCSKLA